MAMNRRTFLKSTGLAVAALPTPWPLQARTTSRGVQSTRAGVRLRLVRNATSLIAYGGKTLLLDPWLGDVGSNPAVQNSPNPRPNPLVTLPLPVAQLLAGIDATLLTHTHFDHWDSAERNRLPKGGPVFVQPSDKDRLAQAGFSDVRSVDSRLTWEGITITPTPAQHGHGDLAKRMGSVTGYLLQSPGLPTIYLAGDTVWFDGVGDVLREHKPDVIVVNAGEARFLEGDPIIMGVNDVATVCRAAPGATVIAVHMEAVNHCVLTRDGLRAGLAREGIQSRVRIPRDGEELNLT